jgi:hypothetical protein
MYVNAMFTIYYVLIFKLIMPVLAPFLSKWIIYINKGFI